MDGLSLLPLLEKGKAPWREYIDIEHSTAYWADNYWCALTDGKIKYIWFFRTGEEQLFDLSKDLYELHDLSKVKASGKTLEKDAESDGRTFAGKRGGMGERRQTGHPQ